MRCLACNYDLKHLVEPRCPECGRAFDPKDLHTFEWGKPRTAWNRLKSLSWIAVVILMIAIFFVVMFATGYMSMNDPR